MTEGKKELSYAEKRTNAEKFDNKIIKFAFIFSPCLAGLFLCKQHEKYIS